MNAAGPSAAPARRLDWPVLALAGLVVAHFVWIMAFFAPVYNSPDANGYFVQARLIATEGRTGIRSESPVQYIGMHWLETPFGDLRSRYPAGFPTLLAGAYRLGGPTAALLVNPVLASAALVFVFLLGRRYAGDAGGLLAAAVVATTAVTNQHALNFGSHIASMFFLLAGVWLLVGFADHPAKIARGLAAGLLLGAVPGMRYPEAICGVAVGVFLFVRIRPWWRAWPAATGAAVPLGLLLAHNQVAFGAFWKTGYALTNEQTGFSWENLASHASSYLTELGGQTSLLFFGLGVAGLVALAAGRRWRVEGGLLAGVVLPILLVYMAYYWGGGGGMGGGGMGGGGPGGAAGGGVRFLIPLLPYFAVGGAYFLMEGVAFEPAVRRIVVAIVAVIQIAAGVASSQTGLRREGQGLAATAAMHRALADMTPAGSVLLVDNRLGETLEYTGRWRLADASVVSANLRAGAGVRPLAGARLAGPGAGFNPGPGPGGPEAEMDDDQPSPMQRSKMRARRERYAGLTPKQRTEKFWADIRDYAHGQPVFWIGRSWEDMEDRLPAGADLRRVGEVEVPQTGPGGGAGRAGPAGMRGVARQLAGGAGAGRSLRGGSAADLNAERSTRMMVAQVLYAGQPQ